MRLYHKDLLPYLPRLQLLQLHRNCCRIRTAGWQEPKQNNSYIFKYGLPKFYNYHMAVLAEMFHRRYKPDMKWTNIHHRGNRENLQDWVFSGEKLDYTDYEEQDSKLFKANLEHLFILFTEDKDEKKYPMTERYRVYGAKEL